VHCVKYILILLSQRPRHLRFFLCIYSKKSGLYRSIVRDDGCNRQRSAGKTPIDSRTRARSRRNGNGNFHNLCSFWKKRKVETVIGLRWPGPVVYFFDSKPNHPACCTLYEELPSTWDSLPTSSMAALLILRSLPNLKYRHLSLPDLTSHGPYHRKLGRIEFRGLAKLFQGIIYSFRQRNVY
jgi:hypothetical protein